MKLRQSILILCTFIFALASCAKVPFTGRKQAKLIPASQINTMSFQQYDAFLKENPPVKGGQDLMMVRQVGRKIQKAAETYYRANGMADKLEEFKWEFNVVDDPTVNAFCMPGGKVVIYTGILPVAKDENGLAVIMGHEIAHALAHHGNERMTQQLGFQGAMVGIGAYLNSRNGQATSAEDAQKSQQTTAILMAAVGLGAQVGILLPFSRKHESEADQIGLYLMAIAGYDVNQAAPFWERMQAKGGQAPPEFMSTHPSPETRSANLRKWAPEARKMAQKYR